MLYAKIFALLLCLFTGVVAVLAAAITGSVKMPGKSYEGARPAADEETLQIEARLRKVLTTLSVDIGPRPQWDKEKLDEAVAFIKNEMEACGGKEHVQVQKFTWDNLEYENVELTIKGQSGKGQPKTDEIIVVGAHYDSVEGCPGANDNGTGVVALLELARYFASHPQERTLKFVAFANEEYYFRTEGMGSCQYARRLQKSGQLKNVKAMLALETIGCFSEVPGSQACPPPFASFYPDKGNFISFISTDKARELVSQAVASFRRSAVPMPSEGLAAPGEVPGVDWSDHLYFLRYGCPALMVTDTAPYRYPYYHKGEDTIDKLDLAGTALVVQGLKPVLSDLARK